MSCVDNVAGSSGASRVACGDILSIRPLGVTCHATPCSTDAGATQSLDSAGGELCVGGDERAPIRDCALALPTSLPLAGHETIARDSRHDETTDATSNDKRQKYEMINNKCSAEPEARLEAAQALYGLWSVCAREHERFVFAFWIMLPSLNHGTS